MFFKVRKPNCYICRVIYHIRTKSPKHNLPQIAKEDTNVATNKDNNDDMEGKRKSDEMETMRIRETNERNDRKMLMLVHTPKDGH